MRPCSRVIFDTETVPGLCHHLSSVGISFQNWACVCYTVCLSYSGCGLFGMWVVFVFGGCAGLRLGTQVFAWAPGLHLWWLSPLTFWGTSHHLYLPVKLCLPHILTSTCDSYSHSVSVSVCLPACLPDSLSVSAFDSPSPSPSLPLSLFFLLSFSGSPGWPQSYYIANDLEPPILLPLPSQFWDYMLKLQFLTRCPEAINRTILWVCTQVTFVSSRSLCKGYCTVWPPQGSFYLA